MRAITRYLAILACCSVTTACAGIYGAPVVPPPGFLFSRFAAPLDIDAQDTKPGSKVGRSSSQSILGLVAEGDASISAAAKQGGISTIRHVDYEFENYLGVFSRFTIVVYGD